MLATLAIGALFPATGAAETATGFVGLTVNMGEPTARPVSLAEIFATIEADTGLQFILADDYFPLGTEISLVDAGLVSLSRVLEEIERQAPLRFERKDRQVQVRVVKAASPATPVQRIQSAAPALHTDPAVAAVRQIAENGRVSRAKKEKQISQAVRDAALGAAADVTDDRAFLELAIQLAGRTANAAPQYKEVIATTLAFTPPVAAIKGARNLIRAAAYGGVAAPAGESLTTRLSMSPRTGSITPSPEVDRDRLRVSPEPARSLYSFANSNAAEIPDAAASSDTSPTSVESNGDAAPTEFNVLSPGLSSISLTPISSPPSSAAKSDGVVQMEAFGVSDTVVKGGSASLRSERAEATVAIDYLSADQLLKYSAADLSEVVLRMPGVSVANGQFAVVRGLSDRFLSTTLNGLKLPSPDPEKQAFQLDLLPTSAVEAVVVSKTFEASLWAESTGGAMNILTRAIPNDQYTSFSAGFKVNQNASDGMLDYSTRSGSFKESLGFGSDVRLATGEVDPKWEYVPTFRSSAPLAASISLEHANVIPIGGQQQIGLLLSLSNSSSHKAEQGIYADRKPTRGQRGVRVSDFESDAPLPKEVYHVVDYANSSSEYTSTAAVGLGYALAANHAFKFSSIWVQTGNDQSFISQSATKVDPATGKTVLAFPVGNPYESFESRAFLRAIQYFRERNLNVLQLSGEHQFLVPGDPALTWSMQRATASQLDHPFVEAEFATRLNDPKQTYEVLAGNGAPTPITAVWADNKEVQTTGRIDSKWAFSLWGENKLEVSLGAALEKSTRDINGTGLIYNKPESGENPAGSTPNEAVAQAAGDVDFTFASSTAATREIKAAYLQATLPLFSSLSLTAGARFEDFKFAVSGVGEWGVYNTTILYDPRPEGGSYGRFLGTTGNNHPAFSSKKWFPGASLKWDLLKSLSVRMGYSKTDGRPSFREVSPLFNKSVFTGNLVVGNPALAPSEATNYDVRVDWRPDRNNFFSISHFRKTIRNPIEKFVLDTRSVASYRTEVLVNNPGEAELLGFEAEINHRLGTWSESLRNFSIGINYTRIDAEVREHPTSLLVATPFFKDQANLPVTRRLFDQPEYIANFDLTWSKPETGTRVTLATYMISDTLVAAGLQSFSFDTYERAYATYDLIFSQRLSNRFNLKLTLKNVTDPVRGTIHDPSATAETVPIREYKAGREFGVSVGARF